MKIYAAIDLKSFYASVECVARGLDPFDANLVVADKSRTDKTICLAVSPALKSFGIGSRERLYQVKQKVKLINQERRKKLYYQDFKTTSVFLSKLKQYHNLKLDFIIAPPQMKLYMDISSKIYNIYLKYFASEDIYVYSIDEVFIELSPYLNIYKKEPRKIVEMVIEDIYKTTNITATAGIGTNLFITKVAMDIIGKNDEAFKDGYRIGELDEENFKKKLWNHRPLTDFWQIGKGIQRKLEANKMYTMGDIARCSFENEELLYKLFGINAELLIDHAFGIEPVELKDIKEAKIESKSLGSGQVLHTPYSNNQARLVLKEMTDSLVLDLVSKGFLCKQAVLVIGYDISNLDSERSEYVEEVVIDDYGRKIPKHAIGRTNFKEYTSSNSIILNKVISLYDKIINPYLLVRRINITLTKLMKNNHQKTLYEELDLFTDSESIKKKEEKLKKEKNEQEAILKIRNKYGKNAILKGMNLLEGATQIKRNKQVGGHKE